MFVQYGNHKDMIPFKNISIITYYSVPTSQQLFYYFIFQHDSEFGLVQSPVCHQQNQEAVQPGPEAQQYVEGENPGCQLEQDLVLSTDFAHIYSDDDFLRFPFVNQEYFTELEPSYPSVLSEEMTTINQSSSVSSGISDRSCPPCVSSPLSCPWQSAWSCPPWWGSGTSPTLGSPWDRTSNFSGN